MASMHLLYVDSIGVRGYLGGSHLSLLDVMSSMVQRGHAVSLACPYEDLLTTEARKRGIGIRLFSLRKPFSTRVEWRGLRFFNWLAALADIFIYLGAGRSLSRLVRAANPDIVHCNDMFLAISAGLACRVARKPCVWHLRAIPSWSVPRISVQFYGWLAALFSDRIIANSRATAGFLSGSPAAKKIRVVYNGIDIRPFSALEGRERTRLQLGIPPEAAVIAIFSRVIPRKGHDVLIEAMDGLSRNRECVLVVVGNYESDGDYHGSLRQQVARLGLDARIKFVGFQLDIRPFLAAADVVVSASTEPESFGRTVVESMAAGKPIIATRLGGHVEIVEDGVTGFLVEPGSAGEIAARMKQITESKALASRMGQLGRARAIRLFSLQACAGELERVYRDITNAVQ